MKPILEIKHISKKYRILHNKVSYYSLRDSLKGIFKTKQGSTEEFYALDNVSFNIYPGESVGIIGKNGAGKSTLLKILSKITPPTSGKVISRGRIASLLEVGTGFHPELTGRENIFLNGSILGMKKSEILNKFDEIVDFSGVEKFLDTPLKHYSSGMQLRLAFAVSAFLEPEILVIDEVLAVGDAEFQKKCMNKMDDVAKSGRTILFVSHNMGALRQLCPKSIVLNEGRLIHFGETNESINRYLGQTKESNSSAVKTISSPKFINRISLKCDQQLSNVMYSGCEFELEIHFQSPHELDFPVLGVIVRDEYNQPFLGLNNKHYSNNLIVHKVDSGKIKMKIPSLPFYFGNFSIDIHFGNGFSDLEVLKNVISFSVDKKGFDSGIEIPDENLNKYYIKNVSWEFCDEKAD